MSLAKPISHRMRPGAGQIVRVPADADLQTAFGLVPNSGVIEVSPITLSSDVAAPGQPVLPRGCCSGPSDPGR